MNNTVEQSKPIEKSKQPIKWRKVLIYFFITCLLSYIISLFVLNSSWFKTKITAQLTKRIPSKWEVGRITWVPFGNIEINGISTSMGEGGIELDSLNISPSWGALFSGDLELEEIIASEGHIDLDLEWLKEQQVNAIEVNQSSHPLPPATEKKPTTPTPSRQPSKPQKTKTPKSEETKAQGNKKTKPITKPPQKEKQKPQVFEEPNKWFKASDLKISFRYGKKLISEIENISCKLPVSGKPVEGKIALTTHGRSLNQKVHWDGRILKAQNLLGSEFGVNYQWEASFIPQQAGMPFNLNFNIPHQKLNAQINKPNIHWSIKAEETTAQIVIRGSLKSPNTWRGLFFVNAQDVKISEDQKTKKQKHFDSVRLVGNLKQGKLHIPTAEAIGYDVSILGNGMIHSNSYSYAVLRIITHKESRNFFDRVHRATRAIHITSRPNQFLERLDTPERIYCDLYFDGKLNDLEIRHNRSNRWQKLKPIIRKIINFKDDELKEDGILESLDNKPPE